jgi:deoxyribodipyrimidine photo-lyase
MKTSRNLLPIFIVDPQLVERWSQAKARMTFLANALKKLDESISNHGGRLLVLQGDPDEVLKKVFHNHQIDALFTNRDYTPFARRRDAKIKTVCDDCNVAYNSYADQLLNEPEEVAKKDGTPYVVFTPYYNCAKHYYIPPPKVAPDFSFAELDGQATLETSLLGRYLEPPLDPQSLSTINHSERLSSLADYETTKDLPAINGTSRLSAQLRFGICSWRRTLSTASPRYLAT